MKKVKNKISGRGNVVVDMINKNTNNILKRKDVAIFLSVVLIVLFTSILMVAFNKMNKNTRVKIETNHGDIVIELDKEHAPISVENFLSYVKNGAYENTVFHRVIDGFMIQGGGFEESGKQRVTNAAIKLESNNGLSNKKGTIAMARTSVPDSATDQFFINLADNDFLDYTSSNPGYAVFGKVIEGMGVVEEIGKVQTSEKNGMADWPVKEVVILKVTVL